MTREEFDKFSMQIVPHTYPGHENMTHQWWCQQNSEEFWNLLDIVSKINPKRVLEIGSAHGGNLCFFDQLVGKGGTVVGVDIDPGAFSILDKTMSGYKSISNIITIAGKQSKDVVNIVKKRFNNKQVDFLFIDGDHTYEGSKLDYTLYSKLVRPGGIIAFHDVAIEPGCTQAFNECPDPKEILQVHYMGIGVVYVQ